MTTEVAVLNSGAIALAADSAVTIGNSKVYNSAVKLFTLSSSEPVGIMIYGNPTVMGFPWEIIIKSFKKECQNIAHDRLEEYVTSFFEYIEKSNIFLPLDHQDDYFINSINEFFWGIFNEIKEQIEDIYKEEGKTVSKDDSDNIFQKTVIHHNEELFELEHLGNHDFSFHKELKSLYTKEIHKSIKSIFSSFTLKKNLINTLTDVSLKYYLYNQTSGIVIAGYGEKDYYPVVETYEIEGLYKNKLKHNRIEGKSSRVTHRNRCSIIPFAQEDMIATFMEGMNPFVHDFIYSYLDIVFKKLHKIINRNDLKGTEKEIDKTINNYTKGIDAISKDFFDNLTKYINKYHSRPVLSMVTALPKEDLALMAETLVSITAFKRKMTYSPETVGGPIDVAVISKTDGFVWIKRKHYFPKDINHRYLQKNIGG